LIDLAIGKYVRFNFSDSSGFFPFNFSLKGLNISGKDFDAKVNRVDISFSKSLINIKKLAVDDIEIKTPNDSKFSVSDLETLLPIFTQKIVKTGEIKKIDADGYVLKDVSFMYDKKLRKRHLKAISEHKEIDLTWQFDNDTISMNTKLDDIFFSGIYKPNGKLLNFTVISGDKRVEFEGVWNGNFMDGIVNLPFNNMKLHTKLFIDDKKIKVKFKEEGIKLFGEVVYDLGESIFYINNIALDSSVNVKPFSVLDFSKIPEIHILLKKGEITLKNVSLSDKNFSLGSINFSKIDLSQFGKLKINGILEGVGKYENGKEKMNLKLENFEFNAISIPSISIYSEYSKDLLTISTMFDFFQKENRIDVMLSADNWIVSKDSELKLNTAGVFDIANYKFGNKQVASGQLNYELKAEGKIWNPICSGSIQLKNCMYANPLIGMYVRNILLDCKIDKNNLIIRKIYARDDSKLGGTIKGHGNIFFDKTKFPIDLAVDINEFKIVDQNWIEGRLFGNIKMKGDLLKGIDISGNLFTKDPKIDVSGTVLLMSRSVDLVQKKKSKKQNEINFPIKCPLNIKFEMRPELKIIGLGIDSSWKGQAKITGDLQNVDYVANANLQKGKIKVGDSSFKLKNGDIMVNNDGINISLSAEKRVERNLVGAKFTQKNDISKIDFYSSPYLSEKDILSYMLFEKASSEISAGEGFSLFSTMNKLSGNENFDIIGKMKTMFKIDSISIKKNSNSINGEYDALSIGKKIGKLKISIDQGTAKDTTNIVVESKIAKNTKISVDLSARDSVGAGVLWSKRY
jgi:hypothetical protein